MHVSSCPGGDRVNFSLILGWDRVNFLPGSCFTAVLEMLCFKGDADNKHDCIVAEQCLH